MVIHIANAADQRAQGLLRRGGLDAHNGGRISGILIPRVRGVAGIVFNNQRQQHGVNFAVRDMQHPADSVAPYRALIPTPPN
ncbi:Uncharacterised protein [Raoultella planticola]|uniref:Uncharacterized protein n=1 Tax=Raoultella planticola TaxID=575 RepID=A0A485AT27_RAOPL|nr:Uncharacterised protein [Raoultella planticola]